MSRDDVIDAIPHLLVVTRPDGSERCNVAWRRFTGCAGTWKAHVHPDDLPQLAHCPVEVRVQSVDGAYAWMSARVGAAGGETLYTFTPLTDGHHRAQARVDELERIADTIPVIVFTSTPDGLDNYHNPAWYRYTGLREEGGFGRAWEAVVHPDDLASLKARWDDSLRSGVQYEAEFRLRRHDGVHRWHLARALPQRDAAGRITRWFGTCTDIDDRKRADDDMRAREDLFRTMMEALPQLVWTCGPDGQVDYLNSHWATYAGVPVEQLMGEGTLALLHPDDRAAIVSAWALALPSGLDFDATYRMRRADGVYRWFVGRATALRDRAGEVVRWFGAATDIDDQKRAEELLERRVAERTDLLRRIADILLEFVDGGDFARASGQLLEEGLRRTESALGFIGAVADEGARGRVLRVFAEQGVRAVTGAPPERGDGFFDLTEMDSLLGQVITTGEPVVCNAPERLGQRAIGAFLGVPVMRGSTVVGEVGVADRVGGYESAELDTLLILSRTASVIYDSYRRRERMRTLDRQRREAEEHLRESNQRLLDLAYVVSHELQEPLRVMDGQLRLLAARYVDRLGRDADEFIHKSTRAARYVGRMVDDLWTYARIDRPNSVLVPVDMNEVVDTAAGALEEELQGRRVRLTRDPLPTVVAVPQQMSIVLGQLLSNAVLYNSATPPEVHVSSEVDDLLWTFSVRDNGVGFDMVDAGEVFKMFRRLQRDDSDRTGMGLAICRRIVEFHGGRMWATSSRGQGATFWFTLPRRAA